MLFKECSTQDLEFELEAIDSEICDLGDEIYTLQLREKLIKEELKRRGEDL